MTITLDSIEAAQADIARYGSCMAAAKATGKPYGHFSYRQKLAAGRGYSENSEPAQRVPAQSSDDTPPRFADAPGSRPTAVYSPDPPSSPETDDVIRVLAIGDLHDDPYLPKDRFEWIGRFAADVKPDRIVQIGDICDLESLSFHSPNDTESGRYKPRFMADMESLDRALDTMFEPMAQGNVKARFDLTLGNHENRIWRFEDKQPETSGMLQRDFADIINPFGIAFHQYGKYIEIGGVRFTHAPFSIMGKAIGGQNAANTVANGAIFDHVFGHSHKRQIITKPKLATDTPVTVIDLGCSLPWGHIQSYAKHTTTGWWWGIFMLTIRNGRIQGHEAIPMYELQRRYA